jgi:prepilin-type N-terminal cleavage/methylation domain-containing protein
MTSESNNVRPVARRRAFTLLELMLVIALIAIIFVAMTPLLSASMRERKLRNASENVAELVRQFRSDAQGDGRRRVLEVRSKGLLNLSSKTPDLVFAPPRDSEFYVQLPGGKWEKPSGQQWEFSPAGMVTPFSVRMEEDGAWIELDFDLLTGRVREERYAF